MKISTKEKRACERIRTSKDLRFFHGCEFHSGTTYNISDHGMFISTTRCLPSPSTLLILFHRENRLLAFSAKIKWVRQTNSSCNGIGVEIVNTRSDYLNFIENLKSEERH